MRLSSTLMLSGLIAFFSWVSTIQESTSDDVLVLELKNRDTADVGPIVERVAAAAQHNQAKLVDPIFILQVWIKDRRAETLQGVMSRERVNLLHDGDIQSFAVFPNSRHYQLAREAHQEVSVSEVSCPITDTMKPKQVAALLKSAGCAMPQTPAVKRLVQALVKDQPGLVSARVK